jgi:hypothetical protein
MGLKAKGGIADLADSLPFPKINRQIRTMMEQAHTTEKKINASTGSEAYSRLLMDAKFRFPPNDSMVPKYRAIANDAIQKHKLIP